jgi:ABC-type multidrug transport system ATPase subunit
MIDISHLSKTYRGAIRALTDVNLSIGTGMFGLVGPNGAGKTTFMRVLAGLIRPTHGGVSIFGNDTSTAQGRREANRVIGYLPQDVGVYPNLTGREFLDYVSILKGINDPVERKRQVEAALETVRLTDVATRRLKTYSGGMKRRIGIAQATLGTPRLLIVDEPTAGLDPEERVRLRNLLGEMSKRCTVIFSTHIVEDISQSCQRLALLYKGEVIFTGSPADLIGKARGHVWTINAPSELPPNGITVVSTLHMEHGYQYRAVGVPDAHYQAKPAEPTLEDGYLWLMRHVRSEGEKALTLP